MTNWPTVKLGTVASIDRATILPSEVADTTPYIGLENINRGGEIVNVNTVHDSEISSTKFRFNEHQVIFGKLRPYLAKVSRPKFSGVCSTDILPISPGDQLNKDYLHHFLLLPSTISLATLRATGANLPRLAPRELEKFRIPLPPIDEQRRIAHVLDTADALRIKRREAIDLLDKLTRSIFVGMFDDPNMSWQEVTVEEIASNSKGSVRTGPFGSQLLHEEFVDSGVSVLGIDNAVSNEFQWRGRRFITEEKYRKLARYTVHPGDILITIMGTCGRCAVVPDDIPLAINTKHLCCITLDQSKCLPEFLHGYFLLHTHARRYLSQTAKGAIMDGLNMGIIKKLPVKLPPIELQHAYVAKVKALRSIKNAHADHLAELNSLFASLQHRAFRGELRDAAGA